MTNNWSVGCRTSHVETLQLFLHDMKDQGLIQVILISGDDNEVFFFTNNLSSSFFDKHRVKFNVE